MLRISKFTLSLLLVAIIALAFGIGYTTGKAAPAAHADALSVIGQSWDILFTNYVDRERLDPQRLQQAAIEGMVTELDDPYTAYLPKSEYELGKTSLEGEFEGIGAHVMLQDGQITIVAPIPDSPAAKAGIRTGDIILEIDGVSAEGMSLVEAVMKIRGNSGTAVTLLVQHQEEAEPLSITIIREKIEVASVSYEMIGDIAHITVTQFSENTDREMADALEAVQRQGATGIVLDLRSNPGGLLETVVNIASYFLSEGTVVSVVSNDSVTTSIPVEKGRLMTDLPVVVLVDSFSASGSEVLAGALQDYQRATIAGQTTFGKGSVNILYPLDDGSGLYITTARWLTPYGRLIEGEGIEPDIELDPGAADAVTRAIELLPAQP